MPRGDLRVVLGDGPRGELQRYMDALNGARASTGDGSHNRRSVSELLIDEEVDEEWVMSRVRSLLDDGWAERYPIFLQRAVDAATVSRPLRMTPEAWQALVQRRHALTDLANAYGQVIGVPVLRTPKLRIEQYFCRGDAPTEEEVLAILDRNGVAMAAALPRADTDRGWVRLILGHADRHLWLELHRRDHRWAGYKAVGGFGVQIRRAQEAVSGPGRGPDRERILQRLESTQYIVVAMASLVAGSDYEIRAQAALRANLCGSDGVTLREGHMIATPPIGDSASAS